MEKTQTEDLPSEEEMVSDIETVEQALPFDEYGKDTEKLTELVDKLEKKYDEREKVISRIIEYGSGIESEKALRMYTTPVLQQWEASLESLERRS